VDALEAYLSELSANRLAGAVPETSGYGALAALLNEVGRHLKPRVRCVINPANRGAGIPDGGFFTQSQFQKGVSEPLPGQLPARGALEVKPVEADVRTVAESEQVRRYLKTYRQVLVTSYREFVLVGYDAEGEARLLESCSLASSDVGLWTLATMPRKAAAEHGDRLAQFLRRCLLRQAPIASPQELAWFLASYAREARARTEERDLPALATTRAALEEALGVDFEGEKGQHFFRSTLVQTLFYGLFAAWVFWAEHHEHSDTQARFRWREAAGYLHIPILQKLFYDFANPAQLGLLHLDEVLDWAGEALNRVDRESFFRAFERHHAVQYFYEPFLEAFDPELRKELGVWYTPPEIVTYMVERVDQVLRSELEIADGLADPRVVVLDPCCGTGAYLVEVLDRIARTLRERGDDALLAHDLKEAAKSRIYGFEILPAPFVISHLQIGMLLHRLGAPLSDEAGERAGVYLTNALTGWEPPTEPKQHLLFTEMEEERDRAEAVKQHAPILVILGNPPYNAFAGISPKEEGDLVGPYKVGLVKRWGIKKFNLDELYVRFMRLAERRIAEAGGRGVAAFISSFSYLDGPSFVVLRSHLLGSFNKVWIDNLNGDSRGTGKVAPDGRPDPSVFSTPLSREGIQVGTAVSVWVRQPGPVVDSQPVYREFWGPDKLAEIADCANAASQTNRPYEALQPTEANRFRLRPSSSSVDYASWPSVVELAAEEPSLGLLEKRGGTLIDCERDALASRLRLYFDASVPSGGLPPSLSGLTRDWAAFDAEAARTRLTASGAEGFQEKHLRPYLVRPFDVQWAYVDAKSGLWNRSRPALVSAAAGGSDFLLARRRSPRRNDGAPFAFCSCLGDEHALHKDAYLFPVTLARKKGEQESLLDSGRGSEPNLSDQASGYLDLLAIDADSARVFGSKGMWMHVLAIGFSPMYQAENDDGIRADWPRIPLPATRDGLLASVELGTRMATLLDIEQEAEAVTTGSLRRELRPIGVLTSVEGDQLDPSAGDLAVTAGWGHAGQNGVTMPGRGRIVERPYTDTELAVFREGLSDLSLSYDQLMACLGSACYDVFLNDRAYWRCVPTRVWDCTIGGFQVMKKWLSYRERKLLDRDLKPEEARYVTEVARRIAAILLLEPALDENYERVKADTYPWPVPQ